LSEIRFVHGAAGLQAFQRPHGIGEFFEAEEIRRRDVSVAASQPHRIQRRILRLAIPAAVPAGGSGHSREENVARSQHEPLRADAQHNRERILQAAHQAFAE